MKAFSGYKAEKPVSREPLPAGGYVAKILNAAEVNYDWGSVLQLSFDILEGEYKDFFAKDYKQNTREDKKWRGVFRLYEPKDDGSEKDEWTKNSFGNAMWAVEESNPGFHWDWKESDLKDKTVGVLFRNKEWEMNGKTGWTTECCALACADDIRNGAFKMPKDKPLKKAEPAAFETIPDDESNLPFF